MRAYAAEKPSRSPTGGSVDEFSLTQPIDVDLVILPPATGWKARGVSHSGTCLAWQMLDLRREAQAGFGPDGIIMPCA
jgi:hypothetical protein